VRKAVAVAMLSTMVLAAPAAAFHPEEETAVGQLPAWTERVHLNGTLEGDFAWIDKSDAGDKESGSASDLLIGTLEMAVEVDFIDWLTGGVVFLAEDLGTEDETGVTVDEAAMAFGKEDIPYYLVVGKRAQPFGVFENHLITDPMTQDAYETNRVGVTAGYTGPLGLDLSATAYKGEEMMAHLFESELFDAETITRVADPAGDDVSSYIIASSLEPLEGLLLFASLLSEPGSGDRNTTAGGGFSLDLDGDHGFRVDGEYIKSLDRELYAGFDRKFEEGVLSLSVAYEFVMREREVKGGALFAERKAHLVAEPLEIAVRYEHFDDDGLAEISQTWSAENRYSAGARYAFYQDAQSGLTAYAAAEYRHTDYRVHPDLVATRADANDEFFMRLGVAF